MICTKCNSTMDACTCPDADARLHEIAYDPAAHVAFKWCHVCDRHYARCQCAVPEFFVICGGKPMVMPEGGFRTAAGGRTVPNLKER